MIKLENINKTYDNGSPLHVLKGIDLTVEKGELASSTTMTAAATIWPAA